MIKINLAKGLSLSTSVSSAQRVETANQASQRIALRNIVILSLGPIVLMLWEDSQITSKLTQLNQMKAKLNTVVEKNAMAKNALEETRQFKDNQQRLEVQIQSIEALKKSRKGNVKLLDYLRKGIPKKVWLDYVEVVDDRVQIRGFSMTDSEMTSFMDSLSRAAFLREVNLLRSQEQVVPELGSVKKFELACITEFNE